MTVSELLQWAVGQLRGAGVDKPGLEGELLLAEALGLPRLELVLRRREIVKQEHIKKFEKYVTLRGKRMPAAYILKNAFFYGLEFYIEKGVLIPRPETELLVEETLNAVGRWQLADGSKSLKILDIGVGSGAIAVALAKNLPQARITAIDISAKALKIARFNARKQLVGRKIKFIKGSLFTGVKERFDVIVSNPPYVKAGDFKTLQPEVTYEPRAALYGGKDGMDFYRRIIPLARERLAKNGFLALEIGYNQARTIEKILRSQGFNKIEVKKDYAGINRIIIAS